MSTTASQIYTNDHDRVVARSRALHARVAEKLRANPTLLKIAEDNLVRWRVNHAAGEAADAALEWRDIIDQGLEAVVKMLLQDSERGDALRGNSPFAGVLTDHERTEIYAAFRLPSQH